MFTTLSPVTPLAQLRIDTSDPVQGTVRVAVAGEIDLSTADVLHAGLFGVLSAQSPRCVEVDLAGVTFMDCGGLAVLVAAGQAAARTGCRLRVTNPQPIVRRILELTGLLDVLTARFGQTPLVAARSASAPSTEPPRRVVPPPAFLLAVA